MGSLDYFETLDSFPHLFRFVVHYDHGRSKFGHTCACYDVVLLYTGYGVLGLLNETVVEFYLSWPHEIIRWQSSDSGVSNYALLSGSFRGGGAWNPKTSRSGLNTMKVYMPDFFANPVSYTSLSTERLLYPPAPSFPLSHCF